MLLVGKPEGKRPLGRPESKWVDNINIKLGEIGWCHVDWIGLAQDRDKWMSFVNAVMNLRASLNAGKLSSGLTTGGLSGGAQLHRQPMYRLSYLDSSKNIIKEMLALFMMIMTAMTSVRRCCS
jgi:hypothetical protein